jgi:hypothetical protein
MTANVIFYVEGERVSFATFARYEHPAGSLIWGAAVSAIHRQVAPNFLRGAVARMRELPSGGTARV